MVNDSTLRRIYALIVVGLLVWPLPHYVLSRSIQSDPWKNFGLAMYATYFHIDVLVRHRSPGEDWQYVLEDRTIDRMVIEFSEKRRSRGTLLQPTDLAARVHAITNAQQIEIQVRTRTFDGIRGQMSPFHRLIYEYSF